MTRRTQVLVVRAEFQNQMGDWAFGCDICQDVCPYNFRAKTTAHEELYPNKKAGTWVDLDNVKIEPGSPLKRSKRLKQKVSSV